MNLFLSFFGCFASIEASAFVVCLAAGALDSGILGAFEGGGGWALGQFMFLPIGLFLMPVGALFRMILCLLFENQCPVALTAGLTVGLIGAGSMALAKPFPDFLFTVSCFCVGPLVGVIGGWVWWRVEKPYLDIQTT